MHDDSGKLHWISDSLFSFSYRWNTINSRNTQIGIPHIVCINFIYNCICCCCSRCIDSILRSAIDFFFYFDWLLFCNAMSFSIGCWIASAHAHKEKKRGSDGCQVINNRYVLFTSSHAQYCKKKRLKKKTIKHKRNSDIFIEMYRLFLVYCLSSAEQSKWNAQQTGKSMLCGYYCY